MVFAMVGESAPPRKGSCWEKAVLPRCEMPCLVVDLVGVAVDGSGRDERELEAAP